MMFYTAMYCFENQRGGIGYHDSTRSISRVWLFEFWFICSFVDQRVWRLIHSPAAVLEQQA